MNNVLVSVRPRVDAEALKDVLLYAKALLRRTHALGVFVTRRCDGSNKLLLQIAVPDQVYETYASNKMGFIHLRTSYGSYYSAFPHEEMTPRERVWAFLAHVEDSFVSDITENWHEANWASDCISPFRIDYKDYFDVNLVRMSTSSNFIQKGTVTFQPPLSEVAIWRLFDN